MMFDSRRFSLPALRSLRFILPLMLLVPCVAADDPPRGLAAIRVPDGFTVEVAAGPDLAPYPMCAALDDRGRLYLTCSSGEDIKGEDTPKNPVCSIRMLEDADADGVYDKSTLYAEKLSLPMGALFYRGSLYVASPPEFLRFTDEDGDGVAEKRETILSGWNVKNTASLHGPFLGPDGWLYLTHGRHGYKIETKEGETLEGDAARLWRCKPDGTELERICGGGFDNPVELVFAPAGEMIGTMTYFTDPKNGQRDALMHWVEGGVYPKDHEYIKEFTRTGELMPTMTKFARIAPAGLMLRRSGAWGEGGRIGDRWKGGLFSAQFNPHRVQFHRLDRDGATFRTVDEDFLVSSDPDFHPTDVLEDADGSVLVVETGGWYRDACPLSVISKPDVRGGVYRVRKASAPLMLDPRGLKIDFPALDAKELAGLMSDERFVVRDRAAEELVDLGNEAVGALAKVAQAGRDPEIRCAAVWALMRVGTPKAAARVRERLWDPDAEVRSAAARACGMAKDKRAFEQLAHLAQHDEPQVRRVACAALGRIGERRAIDALLGSAERATDRFAEHAAIDAIIKLGGPQDRLMGALVGPVARGEGAVKAALIALDQLDKLDQKSFRMFLQAHPGRLESAALWVASRHADWAADARQMLEAMIRAEEFPAEKETIVRGAMDSFRENAEIQAMAADLLRDGELPMERRLFLMDCVERSPLKELPAAWTDALGALLEGENDSLRLRALGVARTRAIIALKEEIDAIADGADRPAEIRVAAIGAALALDRKIGDEALDFLLSTARPGGDAARRLAAAQCIAKAEPGAAQIERLAADGVARADALTMPSLLASFASSKDEAAGRALVAAMLANPAAQGEAAGAQLEKMLAAFPDSVRESAAPLLAKMEESRAARAAKLADMEALLATGDVGRGRRVFYGAKAACSTCHAVGAEGGDLGPDLTAIGKIRAGRDILEALLFPNSTFVPGYEPMRVETETESLSGVLGEQMPDAVVLKTGAGASTRLARASIKSLEPAAVSLMPEGLETALTTEEFADLLAFLQAQNGEEWLQAVARKR